jgi:uncharacterized protein
MGDSGWSAMPALMSGDTVAALCRAFKVLTQSQSRPFAVVLHGGEPLMLGPRRLRQLLGDLRSELSSAYPIGIQTNGSLLSGEILDICAEFDVSLSISVDGPEAVHDRFRIGKKGEGTHKATLAGLALLREHPKSPTLFSGVLAVINPFTDPIDIYRYLKSLGAPSIDFLYRDGNHSKLPFGKDSTKSTEYAQWLTAVLDAYLSDPNPPKVRFLDDLIKLTLGGKGCKEGLGDVDYGIVIVDTDGSIKKNDTLKSTTAGADRFDSPWSVHTHQLNDIFATPEFKNYHALQRPTSIKCLACPELRVCGGGMPLHRWGDENGFDNPSVYCADQLAIIGAIRDRLHKAGMVQ